MIDIVETLESLQHNSTGNAPITFISPMTGCGIISSGYTEYQMGRRYVLTVRSGGWCHADNQSCSPGSAAGRIR